jgi:hypothetical protein
VQFVISAGVKMPEQIISYSGTQYGLLINPDGSINANIEGAINIGSIITNENVYIVSGNVGIKEYIPINSLYNNPYKQLIYLPYSGTSVGLGSVLGSIVQFIGAGSNVKVFGYDAAYSLTSAGSWV